MKPDTATAMHDLIRQMRSVFPFALPAAQICSGECSGCPLKVLDFLQTELDDWDARIAAGEQPGLRELSRLIRTGRKVANVLRRSGLPVGDDTTLH